MEISILSKENNPLFKRTEYIIEISFNSSTPKREEIRQAIIEKTGVSPELLIIKKIQQHTGMRRARVIAHSYKDKEFMLRVEPKYILKRNGLIKEENQQNSES